MHPASASVGPDNEESALHNSSRLSEDALIFTIDMIMIPTDVLTRSRQVRLAYKQDGLQTRDVAGGDNLLRRNSLAQGDIQLSEDSFNNCPKISESLQHLGGIKKLCRQLTEYVVLTQISSDKGHSSLNPTWRYLVWAH
jgi:hypothetical protein